MEPLEYNAVQNQPVSYNHVLIIIHHRHVFECRLDVPKIKRHQIKIKTKLYEIEQNHKNDFQALI